MELLFKESIFKLLISYNSFGIEPVNLRLLCKFSSTNFVKFPILDGITPVNLLLPYIYNMYIKNKY